MRTTLWISCAILAGGFALTGCSKTVIHAGNDPDVVVVKEKQPGPPDHAPAHGHRRKNGDRVILVYDAHLKVYAVENHSHCYYSAGQYFRPATKGWEWSVDIEGPWRSVKAESDIPPGLRNMDVSIHQQKPEKAKKAKKDRD